MENPSRRILTPSSSISWLPCAVLIAGLHGIPETAQAETNFVRSLDASSSAAFSKDGEVWIASWEKLFLLDLEAGSEPGAQYVSYSHDITSGEHVLDLFLDRGSGYLVALGMGHRSVRAFDTETRTVAWETALPEGGIPFTFAGHADAPDAGLIALLARNNGEESGVPYGRRVFLLDGGTGELFEVLEVDGRVSQHVGPVPFAISPAGDAIVVGDRTHEYHRLERQAGGTWEATRISHAPGELSVGVVGLGPEGILATATKMLEFVYMGEPPSPPPAWPPPGAEGIEYLARTSIVDADGAEIRVLSEEWIVQGWGVPPDGEPESVNLAVPLGAWARGGYSPLGGWLVSKELVNLADGRSHAARVEGTPVQRNARPLFAFDTGEQHFLYWEKDRWVLLDLDAMEPAAEIAALEHESTGILPARPVAGSPAAWDSAGNAWIAIGSELYRVYTGASAGDGAMYYTRLREAEFAIGGLLPDRSSGNLILLGEDGREVASYSPMADEEAWRVTLPAGSGERSLLAWDDAPEAGALGILVREEPGGRRLLVLDAGDGTLLSEADLGPNGTEDRRFAISPDGTRVAVVDPRRHYHLLEFDGETWSGEPAGFIAQENPYGAQTAIGPVGFTYGEFTLLATYFDNVRDGVHIPGLPPLFPDRWQATVDLRQGVFRDGHLLQSFYEEDGWITTTRGSLDPPPNPETWLRDWEFGGFSPSGKWLVSRDIVSLPDERHFELPEEMTPAAGPTSPPFAFDPDEERLFLWQEDRWLLLHLNDELEIVSEVTKLKEAPLGETIAALLFGAEGLPPALHDWNDDGAVDAADIVAGR